MARTATYAAVAALLAATLGAIVWLPGNARDRWTVDPQRGPRIVSVAPSVTEILFALGVGDRLVGVTDHCDCPAEAGRIEPIGGFGSPNVERLLELSPELVIAAGLERPEIAGVLRGSGIRVVNVSIRTVDELFAAIREIGEAVGRPRQSDELAARMLAQLESLAASWQARHEGRPRVFVEIWDDPLTTVGKGSYLDDLIARAGGRNVACEVGQAYPHISPEKVVEWDPDVILVTGHARPGDAADRLARRVGWSGIAAVRQRRVFDDLDPDLLLRPGPRLVDGAKALSTRLYPAANETSKR